MSDEAIIDWRLYGVYSFFDQDPTPITCEVGDPLPVYFVRHIEGTMKEAPNEVIKSDFPFDENWSDMAARIQSGMVKVPSNFAIRIDWAHTAPPHPHLPFPHLNPHALHPCLPPSSEPSLIPSMVAYSCHCQVTYGSEELFWGDDDSIHSEFQTCKDECDRMGGKVKNDLKTVVEASDTAFDWIAR